MQQRWLAQYGDIVRTGPNEVLVLRPELLPALARAAKGSWYNNGNGNPSLQLVKDRQTHSVRRRVWDRAFTPDCVKSYAPRVRYYTEKLVAQLAAGGAGEKDITAWFSYYAFDVMGALTFGRDFGMLDKGGKDGSDYFLRMTHASMRSVGLLGHTPWMLLLMERLGAAGRDHMEFLAWCRERVLDRQRRGRGEMGSDLFEVLLEAEPRNKAPHHVPLQGDARTAIVAGRYVLLLPSLSLSLSLSLLTGRSDTTGATLIAMFTYLASSPPTLAKLQAELDSLLAGDTASPYLTACINEALRLNAVVPGGVSRYTPPDGITLDDGTFLPGGVNVYFPLWTAMRDARWFDRPEEFWPERVRPPIHPSPRPCRAPADSRQWLESTPGKLAQMKAVFQPFWIGRYQCVGKPLALAELHSVGAAVARRFDIALVGDTDAAFARSIDAFTMEMGEVRCVFTERARP